MKCEECLPLVEEYVDGELDGRMARRVAAHLSSCAACEDSFAELKREQEVYALYRREVEVTPADWNIVRARIEQERDGQPQRPRSRLLEWFGGLFGPRNPFRSALVAALVIIVIGVTAVALYMNSRDGQSNIASQPAVRKEAPPAIAKEPSPPAGEDENYQAAAREEKLKNSDRQADVGRNSSGPQKEREETAVAARPRPENRAVKQPTPDASAAFVEAAADNTFAGVAPGRAPEAEGDLDFEVARHSERAQLLLRSFRNVRPQSAGRALDVSYEKEQSRRLLYQNIALRRDASASGDQSSERLLGALEPILLDIANLPDRARARDLRPIERRMEKKEMVAALQVRTLLASN